MSVTVAPETPAESCVTLTLSVPLGGFGSVRLTLLVLPAVTGVFAFALWPDFVAVTV